MSPTIGSARAERARPAEVASPLAARTAEELAVLAQRDNVAAFGELVTRFEGRLFNFLLRRVSSRVEAEDLVQEAFVRAWEHIGSYDPTWRFSTWLFTIASRMAVSEHRRRRVAVTIDSAEQVGRRDADLAESEHAEQLGSKLWAMAKDLLRDDQHTALWLRYAEDMTIGEIARVMGRTQVGVRVALFRARQRLAEAARTAGLVADIAGFTDDAEEKP
jgi:RNA polymerase sigma-70 factor (ECF subfamily)